jgi:serralysin
VLDAPASFAGTIAGFNANDKIVLNSATAVTGATFTPGANGVGTLTLSNGATTIGTLAMAGTFTGQAFQVAAGAAANSYNLTVTGAPAGASNFLVVDTTTGLSSTAAGEVYSGPVAGLQHQYINISPNNLNITATVPNSFIHSGAGFDAIDVSKVSGNNVLDGGTNSNFLVGGAGNDVFFVDDRVATSDIWSTVVNFHTGDAATIFGVTSSGFALNYADGEGAAGFTGLTLHAIAPGKPIASITLTGYSTADLANGRLGVSFGTEPNGDNYMYIQGT